MDKIKITANGKEFEVADGQTVAQFARALGLNPRRCVVELNKKALKFADFENEKLRQGDVLEILSLVAGG
ncbi:MAG: sulfur carrier protein ThiS [Opitutales bacterium]|nr:sulfur carrier protein ThiS [Opitutales bacterium]